MKQKTRQQKALEKAAELAAKWGQNDFKPELPLETEDDKVYEVEAVISYFELRGNNFTHATCKTCGEEFAYSWTFKGVSHCSTTCRKRHLESIGIKWDPNKTLDERYRDHKSRPAVVPPEPLKLLREKLQYLQEQEPESKSDTLEDQHLDTSE